MYMLDVIEPDASTQRTKQLYRLIDRRGYSRAELALAMSEAPFKNHYGNRIKLDVVDGIIQEHRKDRAALNRSLTREQVTDLLERHPEALQWDAFHCCGYTKRDQPLYRYAPDAGTPQDPQPKLEERTPRRRDDGGTARAGKVATDYITHSHRQHTTP